MSRIPELWLVICKFYSPGPSLNIIKAGLDKRSAAGTLTYRLVNIQDMTLATLGNKLKLFVCGKLQETLPKVAFVWLPANPYRGTLLDAVRHLEATGVRCINSSRAMELGANKLRQFHILASQNIHLPDTACYVSKATACIDNLLSSPHGITFPAIFKSNNGYQGSGVMLLPDQEVLEDIVPSLTDSVFLLQEYIKESHGRHYRVLVVGGQVTDVCRMTSTGGHVQSNKHKGATREFIDGDEDLKTLSLKISSLLQFDISGLDFLEGPNKEWIFLESNSMPGLSDGCYENTVNGILDYLVKLNTE